MAFRTYKDKLTSANPGRAPFGSVPKSGRGFKQYSSPEDKNSDTIYLGQPPSMKDQMDVAKSAMDIQKDQQSIEEKNRSKMADDMVYRAVFGHPQKELNDVLASSTTGYQDPGATKFAKDPFAIDRMRAGAKEHNNSDRQTKTEAAIEFLRSFSPDGFTDTGEPQTWDTVIRQASEKFKDVPFMSDPRFNKIKERFSRKDPPPDSGTVKIQTPDGKIWLVNTMHKDAALSKYPGSKLVP